MHRLLGICCLWSCMLFAAQSSHDDWVDPDEYLYSKILGGYKKEIVPKRDAETPVNVNLDMALIQLGDVDEDEGEFTATIWFAQEWNDSRLSWDLFAEERKNGVDSIGVNAADIWVPDISIYNSVRAPEVVTPARALVRMDGTVLYIPSLTVKVTCQVPAKNNSVTCRFAAGSWIYDQRVVDVHPTDFRMIVKKFYGNREWTVERADTVREPAQYECCPGKVYPRIMFSFVLTRVEEV